MKKVGIICSLMTGYGGVQVCVIELMKELNDLGIIPELITDKEPNYVLFENESVKCSVRLVKYSISLRAYVKFTKFFSPIKEFVYYFKTSWLKGQYDFLYFFEPNIVVDDETPHLGYLSNSPKSHYVVNRFNSKLKRAVYNNFIKFFHPVFEHQNYQCVINSKFTAQIFNDFYKKELEVVYPPNAMNELPHTIDKNSNTVVCFSRIAPAKRFEKVFTLAKNHPELKFFIAGSQSSEFQNYYESLKQELRTSHLTNVEIIINPPYDEALELLRNCEYYVFFAKNEHFGITTVEAINLGCIPFVHNSGGQKEIVPDKKLRFDDENMEEKFALLIKEDQEEKQKILEFLMNHIEQFDNRIYRKKLISFLKITNGQE